jgi:site-specific recombinase XerD
MKELWLYLDHLSNTGRRFSTVDIYRRDLGLFVDFLFRNEKKKPLQASTEDIEAFLSTTRSRLCEACYYNRFNRIWNLYNFFQKEGLVAENPVFAIPRPKPPKRVRR